LSLYCISNNNKVEPYINLNQTIMKRFLALALTGLMFTALLAACGSSKGGHCDAYGNSNASAPQADNMDLAAL
jgi:hypothetical protein